MNIGRPLNCIPGVHGSHEAWKQELDAKPVRVQWDPEHDWRLQPMDGVRAIQIGLSGEAVKRYVHEWIAAIEDVTPDAHAIGAAAQRNTPPPPLPCERERPYPVDADLAAAICVH